MQLSQTFQTRTTVPEDSFQGDEPLVAVMRGNYPGSMHRGIVAVVDASGDTMLAVGNEDQRVYLRSAAKPFQVMPAVLSGAIDRYGITGRELAVMCASHNGEPRHVEAVISILDKIGLDQSYLRCGTHAPLNQEAAAERWREHLEPSPTCNNCSGAHTGMLVACRAMKWPLEKYGNPNHPLQRQTRQILAAFADLNQADIEIAVDNCAVPTFRISLNRSAQAFARLATGEGVSDDLAGAAGRVVMAMTANPEMVGGEDRFDTDLMAAARGTIVAKGGAEGYQGAGLAPAALGLAIKITDGNSRAIPPVAMRVLEHVGAFDPAQADELWRYREPEVRDLMGDVVGALKPTFQLDPAP